MAQYVADLAVPCAWIVLVVKVSLMQHHVGLFISYQFKNGNRARGHASPASHGE